MIIHASCASRNGDGVLLTGPPGSGKSDLVLRLLDQGFHLVADDQVDLVGNLAQPPVALAGLLEVRGIGIFEMTYTAPVRVVLSVVLGKSERLPSPVVGTFDLPTIVIDPALISAAQQIELALDCALGRLRQHAGAFAVC